MPNKRGARCLTMKVAQFTIPTQAEWNEYFAAQCEALDIHDQQAITDEAARVFAFYRDKKMWRDDAGGKIKFWPRIAEISANRLKQRMRPGYVARKVELHVPDCCFRPANECDCHTLLLSPAAPAQQLHAADAAAALVAAMDAMPPEVVAAYQRFSAARRVKLIPIASNADEHWKRSAATDLGRGIIEQFEGRFTQHADEYFARMGFWLEFAHAAKPEWCHLANDIWIAYITWVAADPSRAFCS